MQVSPDPPFSCIGSLRPLKITTAGGPLTLCPEQTATKPWLGRRAADTTDQPRPDHARVEVRGLGHRLTAPLPAGVSHVVGFLLGLAPEGPGGAFADVIMGM